MDYLFIAWWVVGVVIGITLLCLVIRFLWVVPSILRRIAAAVEDMADATGEGK